MLGRTIITMDFEASSFHGYPIEVGVALWDRVVDDIRVWCSLIRPVPHWRNKNASLWDPKAEQIHGIKAEELEAGLHPRDVMVRLNNLLVRETAFCDGGSYDRAFLTRLSQAAKVQPSFGLGDLKALCVRADLDYLSRVHFDVLLSASEGSVEHRAGPDALRLIQALAAAAGRTPTVVTARLDMSRRPRD